MEKLLENLLESVPRARILRMFMQNPEDFFTLEEIIRKNQVSARAARLEVQKFLKLDIIKGRRAQDKTRKKNGDKYTTNMEFPLFVELQAFVVKSSVASRKDIMMRVKRLGRVRLLVLSGLFTQTDEKARTDLLIVGDAISKKKMDHLLLHLESELGRTVRYTLMETDEFKYRMNMYDRFLRDILEFPHEKLINRLIN